MVSPIVLFVRHGLSGAFVRPSLATGSVAIDRAAFAVNPGSYPDPVDAQGLNNSQGKSMLLPTLAIGVGDDLGADSAMANKAPAWPNATKDSLDKLDLVSYHHVTRAVDYLGKSLLRCHYPAAISAIVVTSRRPN